LGLKRLRTVRGFKHSKIDLKHRAVFLLKINHTENSFLTNPALVRLVVAGKILAAHQTPTASP
jgi:hypothetical protein